MPSRPTAAFLWILLRASHRHRRSLREIEAGLASHAHRLYHLGARTAARSTLADANATRPSEVFGALFAHLVAQAGRGLRRKVGEAVDLIDSTGLRLSELGNDWARFSNGVCGAKLHIVYDCNAEGPIDAAITPARINDITAAQALPIAPGATYVFDLGYYDFAWWARLDDAGCRIVTRLKSNTRLTIVAENRVCTDGTILSDRIGYLPARLAASRTNPFQAPVREIRLRKAARSRVSSPMTSMPAPTRSPRSTNAAGRSACPTKGTLSCR